MVSARGATVTTAAVRGLSPVRTVLESGAVVIVQETPTTPAVTINATVNAGGIHEPSDRPGLAFLTGRVLDRGTAHRSAEVLAEELDDRGVALRIATARHTTAVSCTCLSEDFDDVLAIVLDIVRHPVFPEEEVAKRKAESISAIRQDEDNTSVRAVETMFEMLYGASHPYGRRAKGTVENVERLTREDLARFHATRFVPAALSLAIVGHVTPGVALARAALALDGWSGPPVDHPQVPAPPAPERRVRVVDLAGKSQSDIAYGFSAIRRLDPRYDAYFVMNNILGQFGLGGRLADNIRERQGMAYYAYSALDPSIGVGPLMVRAGVDPENVDRALDAIDTEVRALGVDGPTAEELAQTKQFLIGSIPRTLETNAGIASFLQSEEQFGLGLDYDRRLADDIRVVTIEQVTSAAAELLHPERASVAIAGPPRTFS
jgi:zinc protease